MSYWSVTYTTGGSTKSTIIHKHPFYFIKGIKDGELLTWQKLTFEDITAAKETGRLCG